MRGALPAWSAEFGAAMIERDRSFIEFKSDDESLVQHLIDRLRAESIAIIGVTETRESLEDLFIRLVRDGDGRAHAVGAGPSLRAGGSQ